MCAIAHDRPADERLALGQHDLRGGEVEVALDRARRRRPGVAAMLPGLVDRDGRRTRHRPCTS